MQTVQMAATRANVAVFQLGEKLTEIMSKVTCRKTRGDSQIIVALVLIMVAVVLCLVFRTQLATIIADVGAKVTTQIGTLFTAPKA